MGENRRSPNHFVSTTFPTVRVLVLEFPISNQDYQILERFEFIPSIFLRAPRANELAARCEQFQKPELVRVKIALHVEDLHR